MNKPANTARTEAFQRLMTRFTQIVESYPSVTDIPVQTGESLGWQILALAELSKSRRWIQACYAWKAYLLTIIDEDPTRTHYGFIQGMIGFIHSVDGLLNDPND